MESLKIEGQPKTPEINFDAADGNLQISGRSIPENTIDFFSPVMKWLDEYSSKPSEITCLTVKLEYFNTSSSKCLLDIFRKLENVQEKNEGRVSVKWLFEEDDEDIMEAGEDYRSMLNLPFSIEEY